ncbi:tetratricopeptide repeat protein [Hydrogenovibrio marinus]|uniref:Uncharacterized protein n=1 Tax=Hydrogenovibrio marinus TaxID=28885 RepID=A0A066ZYZ1_HYDMR|nr:tetratricopeptide repeat protein [Hydrogenovibrio marinus]KDN95571.1 hypothetical protein EI16_04520 [Hydrogenovibrio marinus]BBN60065.1 hypothetical protein HVMH_1659 [Hydrogenovibrio marinus]
MSVLLEALKKAAEEKKKQAGQSTHHETVEPIVMMSPSQESVETSVSDSLSATADMANDTEFDEPLALKFNFEVVEQPQKIDNSQVEQDTMASQEVSHVDVTHAATPLEVAEGFEVSLSEEMLVSENAAHLDSPSQEILNDGLAFRLQDSVQSKSTISDDLETRLAVSEFEADNTSRTADISNTIFDDSAPEEDPVKESVEIIPDSWETMHSESSPQNNDDELEASVKIIGSEEISASASNHYEHDWSLEQIPGYQRYGSTESQQKKTRLILPHLISKKTHLPSKWRLYFFSGILALLGLAYYAMLYFDQQSSVIDEDLQRYQILSKPRVVEPAMLSHAELQPKTPLSSYQQDIKQTDVTQSETVLSKAIESKMANKTVEAKVDKTPLKPQKQTGHKKAELVAQKFPKQITPKMTIVSRELESAVSMAFKAYQRSDWQSARRYYQQAYEEDSSSLPALFGLGAVAVQLGEQNKAVAYYQKVLALEPRNQLAQKAILSIQSLENSNQRTIDELKSLAEASPNDSEATFALGNAYAKRKDWVTAQSYYFKAYQHNSAQPIYVLNLAVSLDQLGEYRLAKQYYDEALAKSSVSSPEFDTNSIKRRLVVLNQFLSREQ